MLISDCFVRTSPPEDSPNAQRDYRLNFPSTFHSERGNAHQLSCMSPSCHLVAFRRILNIVPCIYFFMHLEGFTPVSVVTGCLQPDFASCARYNTPRCKSGTRYRSISASSTNIEHNWWVKPAIHWGLARMLGAALDVTAGCLAPDRY